MADLLWSDPSNSVKCFSSSDRKQGHKFNHQALSKFLNRNGLSMLIRGHSYCQDGFSFNFGTDGGCLTVFSSCDYTGRKNSAGIAIISTNGEVTAKAFQPAKDRGLCERRVQVPAWILVDSQNLANSPTESFHLIEETPIPLDIAFTLVG